MPAPSPSAAALELYEQLEPAFTDGDAGRGYPTLWLCVALTTGNISLIHDWVTDQEDRPGWQVLLDPARAPTIILPWLAQFDGAVLLPSMTDAAKRDTIRNPAAWERGTVSFLETVAKRHLTGSKTVVVTERYTGSAWKIRVETLTVETPEAAVTEREIREEAKPIGIVLFFNSRATWTWGLMNEQAEYNTWAKLQAKLATWGAVIAHEP